MRLEAPARAILTAGFGTAVAMWGVGYLARLPFVSAPSPLVLVLMLGCLAGGGAWLARRTLGAFTAGAAAGLVAGAINLLVLGGLLSGGRPDGVVPSALIFVPGSLIASAVATGAGAAVAARGRRARREVDWLHAFAVVAVAATALLLAAGGLVTSAEAGLAVDDWPTSFGYNMFLYPISRMTGGIYFEHAHRLIGALVGLTTLVLAVLLQRGASRSWVRRLGWLALAAVVVQGVLGGLRVTERSLPLAMAHGVLAQLFFGAVVLLAVATAPGWAAGGVGLRRRGAGADRTAGSLLLAVLLVQLVLGAAQRHLHAVLIAHVLVGVGAVAPLAVHVGMRAWGLNDGLPRLQRMGLLLAGSVAVQVVLGFTAWAVKASVDAGALAPGYDLVFTTLHQWFGALLLATSIAVVAWHRRLVADLEPAPGEGSR